MVNEVFDYDHFKMVIVSALTIQKDIHALKEIRTKLIMSAIKEDRNLEEFEICFLNCLETMIDEKENELNIFFKHVRAEESADD